MAKQNKNAVSYQKKSRGNLFSAIIKYKDDYLFMLPYYSVFFLFSVLPVIISIVFSFTYFNVVETPHFIGLDNYFKLFLEDDLFIKSLSTTVVLAVITGPVSYVLCFVVAWMVNEFSTKVRAILTLLFYMPTLTGGLSAIWLI
ncbi:MAG: sugar ABC transporter permease, partial [Clostridia bacterium]|nr:sugar ABC transporter permease [Clostridia bacterium]